MTDLPTYVLEREFDAPRELVWRAWTDPELLPRWYGPGAETVIHRLDLEPGGLWLVEMRWGDNAHYQRVEYTEVEPPARLAWLHSVSDAHWNVISNPMMADWPRVLLATVALEEAGGGTRMRFTWVPEAASEAEVACFTAAMGGMDKGWSTGMDQLAEILAELQAGSGA